MPRSTRPRRPARGVALVAPVNRTLAERITTIINDREWTQTEAAYHLQDAPSQLSLVMTGKLKGFSTGRLLSLLTGLGDDVEITIKRGKKLDGRTKAPKGKLTIRTR